MRKPRVQIEYTTVLRQLWLAGVAVADIAVWLGVHDSTVRSISRRAGLPARGRIEAGPRPADVLGINTASAVPLADGAPDDLPAAVRRTGGRYADMAALAQAQGLSLARVQQLWHRMRVSA